MMLLPWLNHRYTTLNRDWKRITRANMFLCKKRESIETMRVSPSTPKLSSTILFYHEKEEVTNEYKRLCFIKFVCAKRAQVFKLVLSAM